MDSLRKLALEKHQSKTGILDEGKTKRTLGKNDVQELNNISSISSQ